MKMVPDVEVEVVYLLFNEFNRYLLFASKRTFHQMNNSIRYPRKRRINKWFYVFWVNFMLSKIRERTIESAEHQIKLFFFLVLKMNRNKVHGVWVWAQLFGLISSNLECLYFAGKQINESFVDYVVLQRVDSENVFIFVFVFLFFVCPSIRHYCRNKSA